MRIRPVRLIGLAAVFAGFSLFGVVLGQLVLAPSDSARADAFWGAVHVEAMSAPDPTTLDELVGASDAVVIGRVLAVERGREWLSDPSLAGTSKAAEAMARFATVTVLIEDSLSGPDLGASVPLEVFLPRTDALKALQAEIPRGRAMFFLHQKQEPGLKGVYRLVGETASFFLDSSGRPTAPSSDESKLATEVRGAWTFDSLASQVKSLAATP